LCPYPRIRDCRSDLGGMLNAFQNLFLSPSQSIASRSLLVVHVKADCRPTFRFAQRSQGRRQDSGHRPPRRGSPYDALASLGRSAPSA
jgi:hypothetical protein